MTVTVIRRSMCRAWREGFTRRNTLSHPEIFTEGAVTNPHFTDEDTEAQRGHTGSGGARIPTHI